MSAVFSPGSGHFSLHPSNNKSNISNVRWLREASLHRLSMLVKNKTEELQLRRSYGDWILKIHVFREQWNFFIALFINITVSDNQLHYLGGLAISSSSILSSVGAGSSNSVVSSGLSELESEYLLQWVRGVNSGRSTRKRAPKTPPPAFLYLPT